MTIYGFEFQKQENKQNIKKTNKYKIYSKIAIT